MKKILILLNVSLLIVLYTIPTPAKKNELILVYTANTNGVIAPCVV